MNKIICFLPLLIFGVNSNAQSKKDQIQLLNSKLDSLQNVLMVSENKSKTVNDQLINQLSLCNEELSELKLELDSTNRLLSDLVFENNLWKFDTIFGSETHTCYYYSSYFPYTIVSPFNDSVRIRINNLLREWSCLSFLESKLSYSANVI